MSLKVRIMPKLNLFAMTDILRYQSVFGIARADRNSKIWQQLKTYKLQTHKNIFSITLQYYLN